MKKTYLAGIINTSNEQKGGRALERDTLEMIYYFVVIAPIILVCLAIKLAKDCWQKRKY